MSEPKPQYIANLLVGQKGDDTFRNLRDVVYDLIRAMGFISSEEAAWDYVDKYYSDIARDLFIKEHEFVDRGIQKPFEIEGEGETYYIKYLFPDYKELLDSLMDLTPVQFESFCASIVAKFGGQGVVNGGHLDDGIDFIGKDIVLSGVTVQELLSAKVYLLGQAKHYCDGHQVTLNEARQFLGAAVKYRDKMLKESFKLFQPFLFAFWTTSDFHQEAISFFRSMGVWYLNGPQLSSFAFSLGFTQESIRSL